MKGPIKLASIGPNKGIELAMPAIACVTGLNGAVNAANGLD